MAKAWDEGVQRAYLAALIGGKVGHRSDSVNPDLFTGERQPLAALLLDFHRKHGEWPSRDLLPSLVQTKDGSAELLRVFRQTSSSIAHAAEVGGLLMRRQALKDFALRLDEMASDDPAVWASLPGELESVLSTATEERRPFDYGQDVLSRHEESTAYLPKGDIVAPLGLPTLTKLKEGGLVSGELGLILGPTGAGKSQMAIFFGAQYLKAGGRVLHVTLELEERPTAGRYDRALTGWSTQEIRADQAGFKAACQGKIPDNDHLRIQFYPRFSVGVPTIGDLVKRTLDRWGERALVVVDYASILKPQRTDSRHLEVNFVTEALSALAQRERVPLWSPFQTNREGYRAGKDEAGINLGHAGDSYGAFQHAQYVLSVNPGRRDDVGDTGTLTVIKCTNQPMTSVKVRVDWSRTLVKEMEE